MILRRDSFNLWVNRNLKFWVGIVSSYLFSVIHELGEASYWHQNPKWICYFFLSLKYVCECGVLHVILHIGWCSMHKCKTGKVWIIFQASKMYVVFDTDFSLCSRSKCFNLTLCIVYPPNALIYISAEKRFGIMWSGANERWTISNGCNFFWSFPNVHWHVNYNGPLS